MKKVMYLLIPIILLVGIFLFVENVKATNVVPLHYSQQPDIFFTRRGGGYDYVSMAFPYYEINGDVVYCIETGVQVTDWDYMLIEDGYTDENGFNLPYDKDIMSKIQLIGHYGYTYPGHNHYNFRIATQSLIWEIQGNTIVELWTERYGYGDLLNVDKEKAEIMALVNSHYDKPSFNGSSKTAYLNQEIVLEDTSGVLNRFEVYDDGGNEVKIVDNKLYITPKTTGETTISLIKSNYDDLTTIVYGGVDGVSQKMARLRAADPVVSSINLDTSGAKITIKKVDSETKTTTPQGEATLKGAKYNVINSNNEVVETLTIGDDFTATSDYLPLGTYTVKEVSPSTGYKLDQTTYTITINSSDNAYLEVKEEVIKGKIKVVKNDSETNSCNPSGTATLNGAKYEIRDSKNNLVDTITIGNDCTAISKYLPYGKYTIKESVAPTGYNLDSNNYSVDIKNSDTIELASKDDVIKGRIKINKIDNETNSCTSTGQATLKGAKFKITNHNNEVVDTITIKEDCIAISKDLPYGKYKIQEIESPAGYNLNSEVFEQTINEKKDYSITVKNEVIKNYVSILKQYDYVDGNTTFLNAEANITFEIYYEDGTKYGEITTDKNGYATIELPYGNWKFHQVNSSDGFEKIYDFIIKIDENSELEQYYNILNNKIASYLQIVKKR